MSVITNILDSIVQVINSLIQFVINVVLSLVTLISNIPQYLSFVTTSLNTLPAVIIPFALASLSIYIIYLILGRN